MMGGVQTTARKSRHSKGRNPIAQENDGETHAGKTTRAAYRRAPLASLRVFVAVADHKSFTRGADALGLSTGAVGMQVQALEEYLRVPLFLSRPEQNAGREWVHSSSG